MRRKRRARSERGRSTFKELPDLRPILSNDRVRAQVPATPEQLQPHSCSLRKFLDRLIRHIRIILRMKHHDLRSSNFLRAICRVIKLSTTQLLPISFGQPISIPERLANIRGVTGIRSLFLLLARKNRPIHHRAIGDDFFHAWVERRKDRRRPAKTSPDHKQLVDRHAKSLAKCPLSEFFRQSPNHVQDVLVRRFFQELPATLPRSAIARIKHPVSLPGEECRQRLFARDRRHPIAQDDRPLRFPRSSWRQKFSNNVAFESCPEHSVLQLPAFLRVPCALCGYDVAFCNLQSDFHTNTPPDPSPTPTVKADNCS